MTSSSASIAFLDPETVQLPAWSVWPAREAKPHFGAALDRSAHDRAIRL